MLDVKIARICDFELVLVTILKINGTSSAF